MHSRSKGIGSADISASMGRKIRTILADPEAHPKLSRTGIVDSHGVTQFCLHS